MNLRIQFAFSMIAVYAANCFKPWYFPDKGYKTLLLCSVLAYIAINIVWFVFDTLFRKIGLRGLITVEKREALKTGREFGMDIARIIAILFVPFIHFFGDTEYYSAPIEGTAMLHATALRWLVLTAVPLFMIITGYFKLNKDVSFDHYKAIFPVLMTHIVCCVVRLFVDYHIHETELTREYVLDKLVFFNYGWYVRLYIGLLLIIPFLNKAYHGLETRAKKETLILTLIFLTAMGPLFYDVIPATWLILYVTGYYFIGAYIREYKIRINPIINIALIAAVIFSAAYGTYGHCGGGAFDWDYLGYSGNSGYSSLPAFMASALIVILVCDLNCPVKPIAWAAKAVSVLSLEMYLFSQMFDMIYYKPYQEAGCVFVDYLPIASDLLTKIIVSAFMASAIKKIIFFFIGKVFKSMEK
ncbi:MAG: acyltransferase family protein [Eubacterium sp.]|nr:acyltransferase family protein [Eubacterium sp.]